MKSLILASGSQSRREILNSTGFPFIVDPSDYEEDMSLELAPADLAIFLSKGKARDVAKRHSNAVILGADSFGVFNNELLGKPHTIARAKEMLTMLSGHSHIFVTGFTLIDTDSDKEYSESVETKVFIKKLSARAIDSYLAKDDVLDKAGAYTIQGEGIKLITKLDGDFNNVMGLPLSRVLIALTEFGIDIHPTKKAP